jgi:uncharacterized protein YjiK
MPYLFIKQLGLLPFISLFSLFFGSCNETAKRNNDNDNNNNNNDDGNAVVLVENNTILTDGEFRYNLDDSNTKFKLSKKLKEISGLTCYKDKWLAAVQDERGAIYLIDIETGETDTKIEFSADGDYEGIACKDEVFYALRADGVLFEITNWASEKKKDIKTKVIDTNLGEINDTEGLAYDPKSNQLIIACKGSASIGVQVHKSRSIYSYDLNSSTFNLEPTINITRKEFKKFIKENLSKYPEYKSYKKEMKKAQKDLMIQPSAIAVHPITKNYYILCAEGNSLIVINRSNKIEHVKRLSKKKFEQPEGLTFSSNGDLFISTEGLKKKAKIYKFDYLPKS